MAVARLDVRRVRVAVSLAAAELSGRFDGAAHGVERGVGGDGRAGLVGIAHHVDEDGFLGSCHAAVAAYSCAGVEAAIGVVHARCGDRCDAEFFKGAPLADEHVGVHHRHFNRISERFALAFREFGHQ